MVNGGAHAANSLDIQDFMLAPLSAPRLPEAVRAGAEVYVRLKACLSVAGDALSSDQLIDRYEAIIDRFPVWSIEDGLGEDDSHGWVRLTERLGDRIQVMGDDNFVTNPAIITEAISNKIGNSALIKVNQIGTVTETLDAMRICREAGYTQQVSHRSGETEDAFIADLVVGTGSSQLKSGAPARGERLAKYNRLIEIAESDPSLPFGLTTGSTTAAPHGEVGPRTSASPVVRGPVLGQIRAEDVHHTPGQLLAEGKPEVRATRPGPQRLALRADVLDPGARDVMRIHAIAAPAALGVDGIGEDHELTSGEHRGRVRRFGAAGHRHQTGNHSGRLTVPRTVACTVRRQPSVIVAVHGRAAW